MDRLQRDLHDYYERQAVRLLEMARECTDPDTQRKLTDMTAEYIERLEHHAPGEKISLRPSRQPTRSGGRPKAIMLKWPTLSENLGGIC
jgi:hypothetical protein